MSGWLEAPNKKNNGVGAGNFDFCGQKRALQPPGNPDTAGELGKPIRLGERADKKSKATETFFLLNVPWRRHARPSRPVDTENEQKCGKRPTSWAKGPLSGLFRK